MTDEVVYLTQEGYDRFEAELEELLNVRRVEVAERLHQALAEGGELVENAEYEDAKNEQAFVEGRIEYLRTLLSRAKIIEEGKRGDGVIHVNSVVTVQEVGYDQKETFHIVGAAEADPREGRISNLSPLGQALMGKQKGDRVKIQAPDGQIEYVILSVK
jgi:transcription elongation factor GreA